jgi:hypothetical protein
MECISTDIIRQAVHPMDLVRWFRSTLEQLSPDPRAAQSTQDAALFVPEAATRALTLIYEAERQLRNSICDPELVLQSFCVELSLLITSGP